jgi:methyl-accepting chemotaxis protein
MILIGKSGLKTFKSGGRMTIKTNADWNELLHVIRTLAERAKMQKRPAVRQGEQSMQEIEKIKERVDELEKAVQIITEIVENLAKQEAKASNRKRWLIWLK